MSGFPGRIYDGEGIAMDGRPGDLTQAEMDACEHRVMIATRGLAPVGRIWLLRDTAKFDAVPPEIWEAAVSAIERGHGLLLLARLGAPLADIQGELLWCLEAFSDLAAKSPDSAPAIASRGGSA